MKNVFKLEVSKSVGGKKQPLGNVDVAYPTLEELGIDSQPKEWKDGLPVYSTDLENFIFTSVIERVKGMARNKLVSGTIDLKLGATIATSLEELIKPPAAGGNAETLKALAELKRQFKEWLAGAGVTEKGQAALSQMFGQPAAIALQSPAMRAKVAERVEAFADSLIAQGDVSPAVEAYLDKVIGATTDTAELDLDDF